MKKLLALFLAICSTAAFAAGTSNYEQNQQVDSMLRGQAYSTMTSSYVALLTDTNGVAARSTAYALNNTVTVVATDTYVHLYKVTTAGTTAGTAPTYSGVANEAITDGTAVLTEQSSALEAGTAEAEPSGGSYARVTYANSLANWAGTQGAGTTVASTGATGLTSNNATIAFPTPSANWTTSPAMIWGFAIYDAATAGNVRRWGSLAAPQYILTGNTISFAAGALQIRVDK